MWCVLTLYFINFLWSGWWPVEAFMIGVMVRNIYVLSARLARDVVLTEARRRR